MCNKHKNNFKKPTVTMYLRVVNKGTEEQFSSSLRDGILLGLDVFRTYSCIE